MSVAGTDCNYIVKGRDQRAHLHRQRPVGLSGVAELIEVVLAPCPDSTVGLQCQRVPETRVDLHDVRNRALRRCWSACAAWIGRAVPSLSTPVVSPTPHSPVGPECCRMDLPRSYLCNIRQIEYR